ncbi:formate dehydrogenase accessory sulfurtransferase FdhD, partial [Candidatus Bathyarchaeota archaeon]|nr:formate dehydrogenase accessory sulfurtransferase FdhD [Candidatus Bathyarchaeota archaeon]
MKVSVKYAISRFIHGRIDEVKDEVAVETPIAIYINGKRLRVLYVTPQELVELAIGHLITEGFIKNLEEVIRIDVKDSEAHIEASTTVEERIKLHNAKVIDTVKTMCGHSSEELVENLPAKRVQSNIQWPLNEIFKLVGKLNLDASLYRRTGGVHAALIADTSSRFFI